MGRETFTTYLVGLDEPALVRLLLARRDARRVPQPSDFGQLAQRLTTPASQAGAVEQLTLDAVILGSCIAMLGHAATVSALTTVLELPRQQVCAVLEVLVERGLAWESEAGVVKLPGTLSRTWAADCGGQLDIPGGLDPAAILCSLVERINGLPDQLRVALYTLRQPLASLSPKWDPDGALTSRLLAAELVILDVYNRPKLPQPVRAAIWLARHRPAVASPQLPPAPIGCSAADSAAQAAAEQLLRWVTALVDQAAGEPIAELSKGGIGVRERARLSVGLAIPDQPLTLCIDLAYVAGLLGHGPDGYAPSEGYERWRAATPGWQWAVLAEAWMGLGHAPTYRDIDDGKEVPPPLPMQPVARRTRHALITAATDLRTEATGPVRAGGPAFSAAGAEIDWYCPGSRLDEQQRARLVVATSQEAEWLGVVAGDRVTTLGEHLLAGLNSDATDPVTTLAEAVAPRLPELPCAVVLQSDLTATVSGRPSSAATELLTAAATAEVRGVASVWRFGPTSVRAAFDVGWGAQELLDELAALAAAPVPPALAYLINDTARRHGHIRVRKVCSCLVAEEPLVAELRNTKALRRLEFAELAPTVLSSPREPKEVLAQLRTAGFAPRAESEDGMVLVQKRQRHHTHAIPHGSPRFQAAPAHELARRLRTTSGD